MSFLFAEVPGMLGSAGMIDGLAAETAGGGGGQAMAASAVVPPGLEEISLANQAKIVAFCTEAATLMAAAGGIQSLNGLSTASAALLYEATDAAAATGIAAV
jgi:hypothetical protein